MFPVQLCQSQDVQVNGQSVQTRFLGGLNRYYRHTWDKNAKAIVYKNIANNAPGDSGQGSLPSAYTKPVAIVIHGRNGGSFSNFTNTLVQSFIKSDNSVEVIVVDWSLVAGMDYKTAFNAVPFVADDIIALIGRLEKANELNRKLVHLVGFDIGAHIAGIVSRDVKVKKITALSPARENWDANSRRLTPTDADFVEAIHSDYLGVPGLGIADQVGTVDAYLNTGTAQPGCTNNQCNHDRAWHVFAATLDYVGHLTGLGCGSMANMTSNQCTSRPALTLGTNVLEKNAKGIYRVNTGRVYPYNV